jgi:hypothetical protein
MKRYNPIDCSIDTSLYGGTLQQDATNVRNLLNQEFGDYWFAMAIDQCVDPETRELFWVLIYAVDSFFIMPQSVQLALVITENFSDIERMIKFTAGTMPMSTPMQRQYAMRNSSIVMQDSSKKTGLSMFRKAKELLEPLEEQLLEKAIDKGYNQLHILAIGSESKRQAVFNKFLSREGYEPLGFPPGMRLTIQLE